MIRLQFIGMADPASRLIEWFSAGHFSHVDAVMPDGTLLGARSDSVGGKPPGVQIRPQGYEKFQSQVVFEIPTTPEQETKFYSFLRSQLGKHYDKEAIFGFIFDRDWREQDSWICSELQSAALEASGIVPQLYVAANKITPFFLAGIVSAIGGKVIFSTS